MTKYLQNLHTHTTYCDGQNTQEEMILAACEKGFTSLGFSPHSLQKGISLKQEVLNDYKKEIHLLKDKYADRIEIFCGLECEMRAGVDLSGYDYLIGAVHYLQFGDKFDQDTQTVRKFIQEHFHGDGMAYARAYYQDLAQLPEYGKFDIIAHFDLITKHSKTEKFFDETSKEYQNLAIEAAEQLAGKIPYFEINTGAMARGNRTSPYPNRFLIKELKRLGFGAVISTDCHDSRYLDYGYREAKEILKECGFQEHIILTKNGFVAVEI